jgi:replication-associated recombination protein RarA
MLAARCTRPLISDASRRLVFLGPPGVGKGTYARCVSMEAKIPTISTGSLIRFAVYIENIWIWGDFAVVLV